MLKKTVDETLKTAKGVLATNKTDLKSEEVGIVQTITGCIVEGTGLSGIQSDELVEFADGTMGLALNLQENHVGIVLLSNSDKIVAGDKVKRTGRIADVPVGPGLLGRVVDALGNPLDDKGPIKSKERFKIERPAAPIMHRKHVNVPLQTGIKAIDAIIPIGRGQRELIIGDRTTGKTALAIDTMINQKETGVISIYCAIGQRASSVAKIVEELKSHGVMDNCIVVVATGNDSPGLQYLAPYAATSMGEYFMEKEGKDVLITYDNLTCHAHAYRQMSLMLRRPPGREAFPGDIFYIHSRLLERATRLDEKYGGGSLTALPVIETQGQNIAAYIPTNVISITDGQIFLSNSLFQKGVLPAIDVGKSVSRVGGEAQLPAYKKVAGPLKLAYSQFEELEAFSKFASQLDAHTRQILTRGERVREIFKQNQYKPLNVSEQVAAILAVTNGLFDKFEAKEVNAVERKIMDAVTTKLKDICKKINSGEKLTDDIKDKILSVAQEVVDKTPSKE